MLLLLSVFALTAVISANLPSLACCALPIYLKRFTMMMPVVVSFLLNNKGKHRREQRRNELEEDYGIEGPQGSPTAKPVNHRRIQAFSEDPAHASESVSAALPLPEPVIASKRGAAVRLPTGATNAYVAVPSKSRAAQPDHHHQPHVSHQVDAKIGDSTDNLRASVTTIMEQKLLKEIMEIDKGRQKKSKAESSSAVPDGSSKDREQEERKKSKAAPPPPRESNEQQSAAAVVKKPPTDPKKKKEQRAFGPGARDFRPAKESSDRKPSPVEPKQKPKKSADAKPEQVPVAVKDKATVALVIPPTGPDEYSVAQSDRSMFSGPSKSKGLPSPLPQPAAPVAYVPPPESSYLSLFQSKQRHVKPTGGRNALLGAGALAAAAGAVDSQSENGRLAAQRHSDGAALEETVSLPALPNTRQADAAVAAGTTAERRRVSSAGRAAPLPPADAPVVTVDAFEHPLDAQKKRKHPSIQKPVPPSDRHQTTMSAPPRMRKR